MTFNSMEEKVTPERVNLAIKWYQVNHSKIQNFLPFETPGIVFGKGWTARLDRMISLWESKALALYLAKVYIHRPLITLHEGMKARAKVPTNKHQRTDHL